MVQTIAPVHHLGTRSSSRERVVVALAERIGRLSGPELVRALLRLHRHALLELVAVVPNKPSHPSAKCSCWYCRIADDFEVAK